MPSIPASNLPVDHCKLIPYPFFAVSSYRALNPKQGTPPKKGQGMSLQIRRLQIKAPVQAFGVLRRFCVLKLRTRGVVLAPMRGALVRIEPQAFRLRVSKWNPPVPEAILATIPTAKTDLQPYSTPKRRSDRASSRAFSTTETRGCAKNAVFYSVFGS